MMFYKFVHGTPLFKTLM